MEFLKLGHRYVNPPMLTDVFVQDRRPEHPDVIAEAYLAVPMGERATSEGQVDLHTRNVHFTGDDALRLIDWLEARVADG